MATASASAASIKRGKDIIFEWQGKDRNGKVVKGELRAGGQAAVNAHLRRQGILTIFTRQLSTMMKAGVPLLQSFDIVSRGHPNPSVAKLMNDIRGDIEGGTSMSNAFRKHPKYFDSLYCNLVEAGEQGGILEALLDRLATYKEKTMAIKAKIKSALVYPIAVLIVAAVVVTVIMIFVIPSFKDVFTSFGANLPAPTLMVIAMSDFFTQYWWAIFGTLGIGGYLFFQSWQRSEKMQRFMDRLMLKLPIFGPMLEKSAIARWTRTLSTLFGAGVPLVEALDSVGGAAGNIVYADATAQIQKDVSTGTGLTVATGVFPSMVLQMSAIGEESGSLDHMLAKSADFYEQEVDENVKALQSLMEPIIIVILGTIIGGIVVAMYLPIFKLGQVV
jgi:type IV pilus assembly protein PilC